MGKSIPGKGNEGKRRGEMKGKGYQWRENERNRKGREGKEKGRRGDCLNRLNSDCH